MHPTVVATRTPFCCRWLLLGGKKKKGKKPEVKPLQQALRIACTRFQCLVSVLCQKLLYIIIPLAVLSVVSFTACFTAESCSGGGGGKGKSREAGGVC